MPIIKERLLSLINAAESIEAKFSFTSQQVITIAQQLRVGTISSSEAADHLDAICGDHEMQIYRELMAVRTERIKWTINHKRADREKAYRESQRRRQGAQSIHKSILAPYSRRQPQGQISQMDFLKQMTEEHGFTMAQAIELWEEPAGGNPNNTIVDEPKVHFEDSDDFGTPEPTDATDATGN